MLTLYESIRSALDLFARLRIAVRLAVWADLDTTINNVSPSAPIHGGFLPRASFIPLKL